MQAGEDVAVGVDGDGVSAGVACGVGALLPGALVGVGVEVGVFVEFGCLLYGEAVAEGAGGAVVAGGYYGVEHVSEAH